MSRRTRRGRGRPTRITRTTGTAADPHIGLLTAADPHIGLMTAADPHIGLLTAAEAPPALASRGKTETSGTEPARVTNRRHKFVKLRRRMRGPLTILVAFRRRPPRLALPTPGWSQRAFWPPGRESLLSAASVEFNTEGNASKRSTRTQTTLVRAGRRARLASYTNR